jgi:hypothetical protein
MQLLLSLRSKSSKNSWGLKRDDRKAWDLKNHKVYWNIKQTSYNIYDGIVLETNTSKSHASVSNSPIDFDRPSSAILGGKWKQGQAKT